MPIYGDYEQNIASQAGRRPVFSDEVFDAGIAEVHRANRDYQQLTGLTVSESNFYDRRFAEGLELAGLQSATVSRESGGAGRIRGAGDRPEGETYNQPTRELYEQYEEQIVAAGGRSLDDLDQEYGDTVRKVQADLDSANARASGSGAFFGALSGGSRAMLEDPLFLGTMFLPLGGTYKGGSILAHGMREAVLAGTLSVGEERMILWANEEMRERAGVGEIDENLNLMMAFGFGAVFGGAIPMAAAGLNRAQVRKGIEALQGKSMSEVDDQIRHLIEHSDEIGWQWDARQQQILDRARHMDEVGRGNLGQLAGDELEAAGRASRGADEVFNGNDTPETRAEMESASGRVGYDNAQHIDKRIAQVKSEIRKREREGAKPKQVRKAEKALEKLEQEQADLRAVAQRANRKAEMAIATEEELAVSAARSRRAEAEYQGARSAADAEAERQSRRYSGGPRKPSAGERRRLERLQEKAKRLGERVDEANAAEAKAFKAMQKAERAKSKAEAELNAAYTDPARLERINKAMFGFKWKQRKVDKGKPARQAEDVASLPSSGKARAARQDAKPTDDGMPDDIAADAAVRRADDLVERIDSQSAAMTEELRAYQKGKRMEKALVATIACNRGEA